MKGEIRQTAAQNNSLMTYVKLVRAAETVTAVTHKHLQEENLTISQFGVIEALYHLGSMCQRDIAEKILKSTANITTVINNLERRGLVARERNLADRRYISLHLTEQGKALIERIFPAHVQGIADSLGVLTEKEQEQLAKLCRKLGLGQAPLRERPSDGL